MSASSAASADARPAAPLSLEVLDLLPTSVALAVSGPPGDREAIELRVDGRPWAHVCHAAVDERDERSAEKVVVFGLEPGREYDVELAVVSAATAASSSSRAASPTTVRTTTPLPSPSLAGPAASSLARTPSESSFDAPPAYSSQDASAEEQRLRDLIAERKTSAKATESALQASIGSLRRQLDKGTRDDMRARQRLATLEDALTRLQAEARRATRDGEGDEPDPEAIERRVESIERRVQDAIEADKAAREAHEAEMFELRERATATEAERVRLEARLSTVEGACAAAAN